MRFKFDFNFVKDYVTKQGYKLLATEYITSQIPLKIQCPKGHIINPSFSEFKRKARCNDCSINKKPAIEEILKFLKLKEFTLLSKEYINNYSKLEVMCPKKHIWNITWGNLKNGNGCPDCYGNRKHTLEEVQTIVGEFGYKLLKLEFINIDKKIDLICPKNHIYSVRLHDFMTKKSRCVSCSHQTSNAEKEILKFIQQYHIGAKKVKFYELNNDAPKEYRNKELDIFIPELNLAIEYCGLYWHSEVSGEKKANQHSNKLKWCREQNVRLITIFEDEWLTRQEQVKNLLLSVLKIHNVKIGARKCSIKQISKEQAKQFININHIQPLYTCEVSFGLFFNNILIGAITGNNHHRNGQTSFVLQRLCFTSGYQIPGGASKLLKALTNYAKEKGYTKLVSWSDSRISEGSVYEKLNFKFKIEYKQDYSYVLNGCYNKRFSKQSLKKTQEEKLTGKTEPVLRKEQGYYRIWDCGKKLWELNINDEFLTTTMDET